MQPLISGPKFIKYDPYYVMNNQVLITDINITDNNEIEADQLRLRFGKENLAHPTRRAPKS